MASEPSSPPPPATEIGDDPPQPASSGVDSQGDTQETTGSSSTSAQAPPTSASSSPNTRRCFICLTDEPEDSLPRDWATPCTCSLEGHQDCLLDWIASLESDGKELRCPSCKSAIQIVDRWSPAVALNRSLNRLVSDLSPTVIITFLTAGTFISCAAYGFEALEIFAGPEFAKEFLFKVKPSSPFPLTLQRKLPFLSLDGGWLALKALSRVKLGPASVLPLVGPVLVLNREIFPRIITIPASLMVAGLVSLKRPKVQPISWPPTFEQALILMPAVQATYFLLYRKLLLYLKQKLLNTTAKRAAALQEENRGGDAGGDLGQGQEAQAGHDDHHHDHGNGARDGVLIDIVIGGNQLPRAGAADADAIWPLNFLAGALLWPGLCYGMGELMRLVLPRSLVTRPALGPNTGILQERWGRSLVGGCLFVALKDVFSLYVKYRRAMDRPYRKLRNVKKGSGKS
ncbi:hypothetical protein DL766_008104 [Monosporascus sp. MC13-8B]|uniref:RING-CH-type domain-containing protein n=1 Tax=Monosporascus cannonballus TaxID=155416 RepID=A0ABY0GTH2_9PEZI|nr:hypothetical protein DL762_009638 [Monosporascus cannonballus]RYO79517.1 hypothetical protein DL763_009238 [Monosporascus cannonballus]RYP20759.1 hypothetical protein DL766_008104 [Monosporascus sp. MC13-8B]